MPEDSSNAKGGLTCPCCCGVQAQAISSKTWSLLAAFAIGPDCVEILGSERLTGALLDRLTHRASILEMSGDSYRLKQSERKREPSSRS